MIAVPKPFLFPITIYDNLVIIAICESTHNVTLLLPVWMFIFLISVILIDKKQAIHFAHL